LGRKSCLVGILSKIQKRMGLADFEAELRKELALLDYILDIQIKQRSPISLSCTINLEKSYSLNIFYNHQYHILSFSLIYANSRIWGLDKDNRIGWHIHSLEKTDSHEKTEEMKLPEIIAAINLVINKLIIKK
jgi:hypothetical protein